MTDAAPITESIGLIGVDAYPHRRAGHCGSGAMRDLLEWSGLSWHAEPLSEGTVFGLGGELGFSYVRSPGLGSPFYLVGRGPDLTVRLAQRLGIDLRVLSGDDPDEGWRWVRDELDRGRPVLCWADMRELPYLRVRMQMSRHDIVVTGYDPTSESVRVVDNDRDDPQLIPYAALAAARSSTGFPHPTRHTCYPMRFPADLPDRRRASSGAAADAIRGMRDTDRSPGVGVPASEGASGSGLHGVHVFVEDVRRWPDLFAPEEQDGRPPALHVALLTLAAFIEKAGTGGGLFRSLQAGFLEDLAADHIEVRPAAEAYRGLADRWRAVAGAATADPEPSSALDRWSTVRDLVSDLPALEAAAVGELDRVTRLADA